MDLDQNGIATGSTKEDYLARKKFISDFYAAWNAANTTKHIFNKSLKAIRCLKIQNRM